MRVFSVGITINHDSLCCKVKFLPLILIFRLSKSSPSNHFTNIVQLDWWVGGLLGNKYGLCKQLTGSIINISDTFV